jgi:methyl-accepting chemotaxis protein
VNLLNRLSVRAKLALAFAALLVLMLAIAGLSIWQGLQVQHRTEQMLKQRLGQVRDALLMSEAATRLRTRDYRIAVTPPDGMATAVKRWHDGHVNFQKYREAYEADISSAEERKLFEQAMRDWAHYLEISARIIAAGEKGDLAAAQALVREGSKPFDAVSQSLEALADHNDRQAQGDVAQIGAMFGNARIVSAVLVAAALLLAATLAWMISQAIAVPLKHAVVVAQAVAGGDLTREVQANGTDELAQLQRSLGRMVTQLRTLVAQVHAGVESVGTASGQIASGNLDLSQRTEEQAANLQQTAASMEELTTTVQQNAANARTASQLALEATQLAGHGGQVVGEVVTAMADIASSSGRIADILSVIDGIAFQTNILALNAAVEAARAGEQGRGFAVVAAEVRALAQRSAQAAREIKTLIDASVSRVNAGSELVGRAGQTMNEIVAQVTKVNDLVSEITAASDEQSRGIAQIGQAVSQLDQVTQQNAALVEESAAAADTMKAQAQRLSQTVAVFNVGTGGATVVNGTAIAPQ